MTGLTYAADISKYTGPVSTSQWACAREQHGINLAIVGSWHGHDANPSCEASLSNAAEAGLGTATYLVIDSTNSALPVWNAALACGAMWSHLTFAAIDLELNGVTENALLDAEKYLNAGGQRPIIYTGSWFWASSRHLSNPTWGSHLPLWDSHYDGRAELTLARPYGGWTQKSLVGKQYVGSNRTLGFECDLSVFDSTWLG